MSIGLVIGALAIGGAVFGTFYWDRYGKPTMKPWKAIVLAVAGLVIGVGLCGGYWGGPIP